MKDMDSEYNTYSMSKLDMEIKKRWIAESKLLNRAIDGGTFYDGT